MRLTPDYIYQGNTIHFTCRFCRTLNSLYTVWTNKQNLTNKNKSSLLYFFFNLARTFFFSQSQRVSTIELRYKLMSLVDI